MRQANPSGQPGDSLQPVGLFIFDVCYATNRLAMEVDGFAMPLVIERHSETPSIKIAAKPDEEETTDIEDITHEEDESLSIEKKEIELIKKALRKNHNKRKYAAKDLGISERTLYRKIKQYELEDL